MEPQLLVAIGGNLPFAGRKPQQTITAALAQLERCGFRLMAQSRMFKTPCFPAGAGPDYVNAAAVFRADPQVAPDTILSVFHDVEELFGRKRVQRWGGRSLDLDLLAMGDSVLPDKATFAQWRTLPPDQQLQQTPDQLILPHPRLQDRAFVLVPLMDVAPGWTHPVSGLTVRQMCAALPESDIAAVVALGA